MKNQPLRIGNLTAKIPVIQGGMGVGVSLHKLAGSVASSGGIGIISTAQIGFAYEGFAKDPIGTNLYAVGEEIRKARELAEGGIIGVNIMVATKRYEEYVKAAVLAGVDLIISGAGLPVNLPPLVEGSQTKIAPIVSSLKSLQVITKYWLKKYNRIPDLVVIEGPLAGGHLGFHEEELADIAGLNYDEEVKKIIQAVKSLGDEHGTRIPVAAAGGVFTREDMEHYLALGADGVQMATRFVTTYECDVHENFKQAYLDAQKEDIVLVKSPVGMIGRAIHNEFLEHVERGETKITKCHQCLSKCNPVTAPYCITEALTNSAVGNTKEGLLFCGTNAWKCEKMEHVADIMKEFERI